jgi:hypothetical protein
LGKFERTPRTDYGTGDGTIEVKSDASEFAKARELIEIRGTDTLTLQDRSMINLLYANAGTKLCDDVQHVISINELPDAG